MAHEEQKKQDDDLTEQADTAITPLPPREVTEDELDDVIGGMTSQGVDPCLL
jgi:hypothetical protein